MTSSFYGFKDINLLPKYDTAKCIYNKGSVSIYECSNMDSQHTTFLFFKYKVCFYKEICEGTFYLKFWLTKFIYKITTSFGMKITYAQIDKNILNIS